jgi:hypothetical protein
MLDAACKCPEMFPMGRRTRAVLEAALLWQRENPPVPSYGETKRIWMETGLCNEVGDEELRCIAAEWIRRMYDAPEPEESFEEKLNALNVEINKIGMTKAIEILRNQKAGAK